MRQALAILIVAAGVFLTIVDAPRAPWWAGLAASLALIAAQGAPVASVTPAPRRAVTPPPSADAQVLEALPEAVLLIEGNRVATANAAARALLGAHIVGEDVRLAIRHPSAAEQFGRAQPDGVVELADLGGSAQRLRMEIVTLSDTGRDAGGDTGGDTGGNDRRLVHLSDRSLNHAAERARVDFVANASHELRTPLAAILGFVETLSDDSAGGDAGVRARFLAVTMKEAQRMQRLIDDLISLSRIEAEKYTPLVTRLALGPLVALVVAEQGDADAARKAGTTLRIDDDLPEILGDRAQLSQIIHNLLDNAFRYGRAPVAVRVLVERGHIRMSISDHGDGIAADHVPRLTERFYRVDASRSRSVGGTGLGLAIVKHIVERHRGRLDIASKPGSGTIVSVILPLAPPTNGAAVIKASSN